MLDLIVGVIAFTVGFVGYRWFLHDKVNAIVADANIEDALKKQQAYAEQADKLKKDIEDAKASLARARESLDKPNSPS